MRLTIAACAALLFALPASAADFTLPSENQGWWTPGAASGTAGVGVPGGIEQYIAGGVNDRAVTGTVHDVTASPYFVTTSTAETTGSISAGSTTLTVADSTGFEAGNYISVAGAGTATVLQSVVSAGASSSGTITITLDGPGAVSVSVTAGDSATVVASAIRATSFAGYTTGGSGTTVTYTATTIGFKSTPVLGAAGTGVAATNTRTATSISYLQIDSKVGNTITLEYASAFAVTDVAVTHDPSIGIGLAIAAAASGDVVYLPAGTYRIDSSISIPYGKNNITFRGAGSQASGGTTIVANGTTSQTVMTIGSSNSWEGNTYQDISGTLTKGTTNLTVASSSSFAVDGFAVIKLENENDDTRIQAGAAPTWSSGVFPAMRRFIHRVVAKPDATTVTIEPPLMLDATNYAPQIVHGDLVGYETRNVGVEGLRFIGGENAAHFAEGILLARGIGCWIYDVHFERAGTSANGNCIKLYHGYRNEVRKCTFVSKATTFDHSDGAIQYQWQTSLLIEDNSFMREGTGTHGWNVGIYSDGYIHNSVHAFNSFDACNKNILIAHTGGPCMLNLYEGNIGQRVQHDGYFNSTSHNTLYRNWFSGRQIDGTANPNGGYVSWFKRFSRNFALVGNVWGWDGLNAAGAGELQMGYPNTGGDGYTGTAQPTLGDFWSDWAAYKAGTYTAGTGGFQELDLDVEPSFTITHNYMSSLTTGSVTNSTADTLPASMFRTAKPDYFGTLTWPAINPDAPEFSNTAIPSSYRYLNGNEDYLGPSAPSFSTQPATQTATVGDNVTLTVAGGGNPSPTLQWRKGGVNISGETSSSLVLTNVQLGDAGSYDCVATNTEGTATSSTAVLTVNAAPSGGGTATATTANVSTLNLAAP